jgi:ribosomal protein L20A (L18A)
MKKQQAYLVENSSKTFSATIFATSMNDASDYVLSIISRRNQLNLRMINIKKAKEGLEAGYKRIF